MAFHVLGVLSILLFMQKVGATQFKVGGEMGWTIPSPSDVHYNQWAENTRFRIGDSLLFVYQANDSVLEVNKDEYTFCNTTSFIHKYTGGHTVYSFNRSGHHYFISGIRDNCLKNEQMVVVVLSPRTSQTNTEAPSPAPAGEESPSPTPSVTEEANPSPSPVVEESPPHHNGASSTLLSFISFTGSVGAFVGSSLILAF